MSVFIAILFISGSFVAIVNCGEYYRIDGRTYYSSYPDMRNWYQAKRFCTYNGMHLIDVRTAEENARILSVINQTETGNKIAVANWWTSGTDLGTPNMFYWDTSGHPLLYWDWAPQQPDDGHAYEHCVHYWDKQKHKWNDAKCDYEWYFICRDTVDSPIYKRKDCAMGSDQF